MANLSVTIDGLNITLITAAPTYAPIGPYYLALRIVQSTWIALVLLLSLCGNFLASFTLYRCPYLLTPSNKLVFNLCTSSFIFSAVVFPFILASSIAGQWLFGKVWCSLTGFLSLAVLGSSMLSLSVVALDRYYAVVQPLRYPCVVTQQRITIAIIMCWIVSSICSVPPLFGAWSQYRFSEARSSCFASWSFNRGFTLFWLTVFIVIPLSFILTCYCCILRIIRKNTKKSRIGTSDSIQTSRTALPAEHLGSFFMETPNRRATSSSQRKARNVWDHTLRNEKSDRHVLSFIGSESTLEDSGIMPSLDAADSAVPRQQALNLPHEVPYDDREEATFSVSNGNKTNEDGQAFRQEIANHDTIANGVECNSFPAKVTTQLPRCVLSDRNRNHCNSSTARPESPLNFHCSSINTRASSLSYGELEDPDLPSEATSQRQFAFSRTLYYQHYTKAVWILFVIVGVLVSSVGPFAVVGFLEAVNENSTIASSATSSAVLGRSTLPHWLISLVTLLMYSMTVYYPMIYGLWNDSLRREMVAMLCRKRRASSFDRSRMLSLSAHIKDLGTSPQLIAATMAETATMVALTADNQKRSKLSTIKCERDGQTRRDSQRSGRRDREVPSRTAKSDTSKGISRSEAWADPIVATSSRSDATACTQQEHRTSLKTRDDDVTSSNATGGNDEMQMRLREKPAIGGLLDLTSPEVLGSEILQSVLLYGFPTEFDSGSAVRISSDGIASDGAERERNTAGCSRNETETVNRISRVTKRSSSSVCVELSGSVRPDHNDLSSHCNGKKSDSSEDIVSKLTSGRLGAANLIHLEAGEPIRKRKWSKPQVIDYFAQTFAYSLLENATNSTPDDS